MGASEGGGIFSLRHGGDYYGNAAAVFVEGGIGVRSEWEAEGSEEGIGPRKNTPPATLPEFGRDRYEAPVAI